MKRTFELSKAWTFHTPAVTIDFAKGANEVEVSAAVADEIEKQAREAGVLGKEKADGGSSGSAISTQGAGAASN